MPSLIQQNRYDQLVRRVGGIVGPGSKVSEALTELFPMIDVENCPAELLILSGTRIGAGSARVAGVAGEIPKIQLFNPASSGLLVTITSVWLSVESDSFVEARPTNVAITTPVASVIRDTRQGPTNLPTATLRTESSAGGITQEWAVELLANTPFHLTDPNAVWVLGEGTGLTFDTAETNRTLSVSFMWRERPFQQSEVNF